MAITEYKIETFLNAVEQNLFFPVCLVVIDDLKAGQNLEDLPYGDYWTDSQFHENASVAGQNGAHPVERVITCVLYYAVQRDLTTNQEHKKRYSSPYQLVFECHLTYYHYTLFSGFYISGNYYIIGLIICKSLNFHPIDI